MSNELEQKAKAIQLTEQDEIQQILGNTPSWILRWGMLMVVALVAVLFAVAWWVQYPDVIVARATIQTEQAAVRIAAPIDGTIEEFWVEHGSPVEAGQLLAIFKNTADWQAVQELQQYLEAWAKASDYIFQQELPILDQLGSMQPLYADFSQKLRAYQYLAGTTSTAQKIKAIQQQRQELVALNATLERQQAILAQEVALAKQKLEDDKTLLSQNAATATDVDASETEYLAYSRQLEGLQGQIINNRIRREELSVQLVELREVRDQQLSTERIALNEDRKRLQQALDDWEAQFLVRTPIAGRVSMQQLRTPQQYLQAATEILTILPATAQNRILAKAEVAPQGFGKLELGQEVQLRLAGYPYQEYGALEGQVSELANIPENGLYTATVSLVSPLVTNANDTIPFQQELLAEARFITADKRVLQRIFDRFDALFRD